MPAEILQTMPETNERIRHFLDLNEMEGGTLRHILDMAKEFKQRRNAGEPLHPLPGKTLGMIFEKNSTRTRASFEVGMYELGGYALFLSHNDMQLERGESIADTARVLSRYVDAIMIRCMKHDTLLELARHATVPVINGLTDQSHPCQIMADIMTFEEHRDMIAGHTVAWVGDGNNVLHSWIHAADKLDFKLRVAAPEAFLPDVDHPAVTLSTDPNEAVQGAELVLTDTWVSMGEGNPEARKRALQPYQINEALMSKAAPGALFMHCLPATRGEEVTAEVIDGPRSVVFDEAENRLHAQKGVLVWCMEGKY